MDPPPVKPEKVPRLPGVKESLTFCTLFTTVGIGIDPDAKFPMGAPITEVVGLGKRGELIWFPVTELLNPSCRSNCMPGLLTGAPLALKIFTVALTVTVDLNVTAYKVEVDMGNWGRL